MGEEAEEAEVVQRQKAPPRGDQVVDDLQVRHLIHRHCSKRSCHDRSFHQYLSRLQALRSPRPPTLLCFWSEIAARQRLHGTPFSHGLFEELQIPDEEHAHLLLLSHLQCAMMPVEASAGAKVHQ